jgi:sugar phosphate isomerase/epimerase
LCLDVGHLLVTRDLPVEDVVRRHASELAHVHLDDIHGSVHEHLMFGRGELDLRAALRSLIEVGYRGLAAVELSRDSHRGAQTAAEALSHVRRALDTN